MSNNHSVRCHYDVLQITRDADGKTIKKAHRKLALKYHPDKTGGCDDAAKEFRLVQQAYECLSDPSERKWYDEHRESILRGGKGFGDGIGDDAVGSSFIFDVTPYHFSGCFDGYSDDEGGFFHVYRQVFENILKGERNGWVSEGNIDETKMPNAHLPSDFGDGSTEWKEVSHFYNSWESFNSCLSFAFADKYDPREADSRWERRRIDEENKKSRKIAKKERNQEISSLVAFVKKRDPRVHAAKEKAAEEKALKEKQRIKDEEKRKKLAAEARQKWRTEREKELREIEIADLNAGRIRLEDLSDSDDDYYRGKRGKKGKRNKKRWKQKELSDDEDELDDNNNVEGECDSEANTADNDAKLDDIMLNDDVVNSNNIVDLENDDNEIDHDDEEDEEEESSEESEPEFYRCECCRKTFKSDKQLENHLNSKKHREVYKKWLKKNGH